MEKTQILKSFSLIVLILFTSGTLFAQKKLTPEGTWKFKANEAPYEYSSGDIVIDKENKEYKVTIVFNEYTKLKGNDVKVEDDKISFKAYVEGEVVNIKGSFTKDELNGKASYSEGTIPFESTRKKEK